MSNERTFWSYVGLLDYALSVIGSYYTESILIAPITKRSLLDDLGCLTVQSFCYFICPLYPFLMALGKRTKDCFSRAPPKTRGKKQDKVHLPLSWSHSSLCKPAGKRQKQENVKKAPSSSSGEKAKIVLFVAVLAVLNICNRLLLCKSLEYTTYPIIGIVRTFRVFPVSLDAQQDKRQPPRSLANSAGVAMGMVGIFSYIFSPEEKVENIYFLGQVLKSGKPEGLRNNDMRNIIRLSLRFLHYHMGKGTEKKESEEEVFMTQIYNGERAKQDFFLPIKEQAARYYHGLVSLYVSNPNFSGVSSFSGVSRHSSTSKTPKALEKPDSKPDHKPETTTEKVFREIVNIGNGPNHPAVTQLAYSFIRMICTGNNPRYFRAFLERRKINAAVLLTLFSWTEMILDAGQVTLANVYGIDHLYILYGVNIFSSLLGCGVLAFARYPEERMLQYIRRDVILSAFALSLTRMFSYKDVDKKYPMVKIGLHIGKRFFALFTSIIFFGHDFNAGHVFGIVLVFIACLLYLDMNEVLLSRWSFQGLLKRRSLG
ncbi:hypothetical protein NEDG_00307 [Nematocida displodere]|uniref:Uncharacterized protein n=1 Tax=Nematocida displodere TaxID=1805483 RepID=A0A177EL51_9MICR|nr:hypothetical protein NEDG_00307 [Nematocida displodere]